MITASDSFNTVDLGRYFAILPMAAKYTREHDCERNGCQPVEPGFAYNSGGNPDFLTVDPLRELIRQHVEPSWLG